MPYTSWSVSFGEVPSASKWNILGANDAWFNTQITQDASSHTVIKTPTSNKLVKFAALRQDNTTNAYEPRTVIHHGWGFIVATATQQISEVVTFGITFDTAPTVHVSTLTTKTSDPADITELTTIPGATGVPVAAADDITTTSFRAYLDRQTNFTNGTRYGYAWLAIGKLNND